MGSSIGIAAITTLLAQREAVHRAVMVEKITLASTELARRAQLSAQALGRHSADSGFIHQQAMALLDQAVNAQALLLSFADVFFYVAIAFLVTLPLLLLLNKGGNREAAAAAAH